MAKAPSPDLRAPAAPDRRERLKPVPENLAPSVDKENRNAPPSSEEAEEAPPAKPEPSLWRRHRLAFAIAAVVLAIAAVLGAIYWDHARHFESTDDAFVDSRQFAVASKVTGYVVSVPVTDNQHVKAGDILAQIDERDYRTALDQAQAQVRAAEAAVINIDAQIEAQQAQVIEAQNQVKQAQAALGFAGQEASRYQELAQKGAGTIQQSQQSTSNLQQQQANFSRTQASVNAAQRQVDALRAQRHSGEASLAQAKAQLEQAQLNLSYTTVMAAQSGRVVRLTGAVGQLASAGGAISMFVPDELWVTANFKETQLANMRPGQPVEMRIDAYPGRAIKGHVASIQPGSGTAFSLLPAENATGNYVKIVQRVPVKLAMDAWPTDVSVGPGMSVVPTARVLAEPSFYERLTGKRS